MATCRFQRRECGNAASVPTRDPFGAANVKQLVGQPGYRLRVGDWRVIYEVEQGRLLVRVLRIAPRGGAYE